ncbi:MAG TPA: transmembrane repetitive protein, partial [Stenotrophomonas sp.]
MTKAADLIEALLARKPGRPVLDRRSGLPYAWGHWVRNRDVVADVAYGSPELVQVAEQRPSRRRAGVLPALSPLQAFRRLWWQQWDPRPRDERPYHWLAVSGSFLIHALFLLLLLWVAVVRWAKPPETPGEEGRVRLEMVGRGTPEQVGGGAGEPAAGAATASATASASPGSQSSAGAQPGARPA